MSIEDDLLALARQREAETDAALIQMLLEPPDRLRRQLRTYLSRQVDRGRMKRTDERLPLLTTVEDGLNELACQRAEFSSGTRLDFNIQLEQRQGGWIIKRFRFHVRFPNPRRIEMVRIHLNPQAGHDPLAVPRCHLHIGDGHTHVPFPVTDPRLILHLICEYVEPDFGV